MTFGQIVPRRSDGVPYLQPKAFPETHRAIWIGEGDDWATKSLWNGQAFQTTSSIVELQTLTVRFIGAVYVVGGFFQVMNALAGDWANMIIYAPPSVPSAGAGDFNKVPIPGGNLIVPSAPGAGAWDIPNLQDMDAVIPVPTLTGDGFFDWDETNGVTVNFNQKGGYNLLDFRVDMRTFLRRYRMIGNATVDLVFPSIGGEQLLPHWAIEIEINSASTAVARGAVPLTVSWAFLGARQQTV